MVEAYHFAENAPDENDRLPPAPFELILLGYIERFGVKAVTGRDVLSAGEIRRMITADNIRNAYQSRRAAQKDEKGWAGWAAQHPNYDAWLKDVEKILHGTD